MCIGGGGGGSSGDGGAGAREAQRQAKIQQGYDEIQGVFGSFNDDFYNNRAKSYIDYATPQLEDQFSTAMEQLTYALARNNRLDSSVAAEKRADLNKQYGQQKTAIADKGLSYANRARDSVNQSRMNLNSINSSIADPNQILQQSQIAAQGLSAADSYEPLAPLFVNVASGLGTQADVERRNAQKYDTNLFTPSPVSKGMSSQRIIN